MENKWINIVGGIVFLGIAAAAMVGGLVVLALGASGGIGYLWFPILVIISTVTFFLYAGFKNLLKGGKEFIAPEPAAPETAPSLVNNRLTNSLIAFVIAYVLSFALPAFLAGSSPDQSLFQGAFSFPVFLASLFAYSYILNQSMSLQGKVVRIVAVAIVMLALSYLPQIAGLYLL